MSDKQLYVSCWYPSEQAVEENGARRVAYSFYAANEKQARAKATLYFMEQFPDADDTEFELKIYVCSGGIPCSEFETWDENFLYEFEWNDEVGHPVPTTQVKPVEFDKLSASLRVAVLVKYRTTEITNDQLTGALEEDGANTFDSHIADAIIKTPAVAAMYPERILEAIDYIREKCPPTKKWPEIKAVLAGWLNHRNEERKDSSAPVSVVDAARQNAAEEKLRVPSGATAGGGNLTDRGEDFKHDFDSLELEVALGLVARAMDFDIYNLRGAYINRAREIIKLKERPFPALFSAYRNSPGILDYSRAIIIYSVKTAPENIESTPGKLAEYINKTLTETDHVNPDPHIVAVACGITAESNNNEESEQNSASATGALADEQAAISTVGAQQPDANVAPENLEDGAPVERTGPFYYRTTDGQVGRANKLAKLEAVIAQGCEEITKEEYQSLKDNPPVQQQGTSNRSDGVYSVKELTGEEQQTKASAPSSEDEKTEASISMATTTTDTPADNFQQRAEQVEKEIAEQPRDVQDNLSIWRKVHRTDEKFTKAFANNGGGTSINGTYMVMQATKVLGPQGINWKVDIIEERFDNGAPIMRSVKNQDGNVVKEVIPNGIGGYLTEVNHTTKVRLWYLLDGKQGEIFAYGCTPYIYNTKNGLISDGEAPKKSLTDATKKALSQLGFSADVYLGLFDDQEYRQENKAVFTITNASEKAGDTIRLRKELDERIEKNLATIKKSASPNEAKGVYSTITREVDVYRKDAQSKADNELDTYLKNRLLTLHKAVELRVTELEAKQNQEAQS